eukprot:8295893-Ditylum_brightwellii.AAC.1
MFEYSANYMGLIKINLNTTNHEFQKCITEEIRKWLQLCNIQLTSSNVPMENFYKPGGVMSISQGDILSRKITEGRDHMG